jgi:hypothetical protein
MIIKQISPADNWWAIFRGRDEPIVEKVACWATIANGPNDDFIAGMVDICRGFLGIANTISNFQCYVYAENEIKAYDKAIRYAKEED